NGTHSSTITGSIDSHWCGGFGQAVTLFDVDANASEEVAKMCAERSASGDRIGDIATHGCSDFCIEQLIKNPVFQSEPYWNTACFFRLRVLDCDVGTGVEDFSFPALFCIKHGRVVNFFKNPGDRQDEVWLIRLEVWNYIFHISCMAVLGTCSYSLKGDEACKDVWQAYDHDGLASAGQYGAHFRRQDVEREIHQVAVRNHAALGSASCSGGIHDCGYIV